MTNTENLTNATYLCRYANTAGGGRLLITEGDESTPIKLPLSKSLSATLVDGDTVLCTVKDGKVVSVELKERENYRVTGKLTGDGGVSIVLDNGSTLPVSGELPESCHMGDKVLALLNEDSSAVKVVHSFGSAADAEPNFTAIIAKEQADRPFRPEAVMQARQSAFTEINTLMSNRTDLRGKTILTLSATDSSRTECGFSVELDKNGNYLLGLHTADVAVFVPEGGALDAAAAERGKTIVLPNREIHMLPETLSKGPCFLEIGKDRLALSYLITISPEGKVLDFDFCESIINTAANCLFDEIDALILSIDNSAIMPLRAAYAAVMPTISHMFALGGILQNARVQNGGCEFDKSEQMFVFAAHGGKPIGVVSQQLSDPKKLIREFLAVAGKELALYLNRNNIPAIYRVQAAPEADDIKYFRNYVGTLGIETDNIKDKDLLSYVGDACHGLRTEQLIIKKLRKTLPKATFSDKPVRSILHGTEMFLRFAYPLNRYADLCIQRIVKAIIAAGNGEELDRTALHSTVRRGICSAVRAEARTSRIENTCEAITALEILRRAGNKTYSGIVADFTSDGTVVYLDNGCVGLVAQSEVKLNPGDSVNVTPVNINFENSTMLLSLV